MIFTWALILAIALIGATVVLTKIECLEEDCIDQVGDFSASIAFELPEVIAIDLTCDLPNGESEYTQVLLPKGPGLLDTTDSIDPSV